MRFNLSSIIFAVFMLIGLMGSVYAYGDFNKEPANGYSETATYDTYLGFYSDTGYSVPAEQFNLGDTIYIRINSTDITDCSSKNQVKFTDYLGNQIGTTQTFTCTTVGGRTVCDLNYQLSAANGFSADEWYIIDMQCQDASGTKIRTTETIAVGSTVAGTHYIRLFNDSSYSTSSQTVWYNTSATIYFQVYGSGGTYDPAQSKAEVGDFLGTKDNTVVPSCTQNGNIYNCTFDLGSVTGVTLNEGDWYYFAPDMKDSSKVSIAKKITGIIRIDLTGPTTSNVVASPNPTEGASSITVNATVDDTASNNATVNYVNYSVYQGNACSGTAVQTGTMQAVDGAFDSSQEDVTATISTSSWTLGNNYTICITGRDIAYNFGSTASVTVEHKISDSTPPNLTYESPTPSNGSTLPYGTSSVTINVSSNETLDTCVLDWNGVNQTFAPTSSTLCTVTKTVTNGGSYTYTIYANDSAGNMASAGEMSFSVQDDTTAPTINSVSDSPDPVVQGQNITFTINCSDDISGVNQVLIDYNGANHTATGTEPSYSYTQNTSGMATGTYSYTVYCSDAAGNTAVASGYSFTVAPPVTYDVYGYVFNASHVNFTAVQGASVALLSSGSVFKETTTDAQGFYNLTGIYQGNYDLVANITGFGAHWIRNITVNSDLEKNMTLGPPKIYNHRPGGKVVNTTKDCAVCHKNSVMTLSWDSAEATNDTANSTIHYITEVTKLPGFTHNALDTTNCVQCHIGNGAYVKDPDWGTPWNASAPSSDPAGRSSWRQHTETTNSECVTCHGNVSTRDFHARDLTIGGSGPDCKGCHDIGGSAPKHINFTALLNGVHGKINTTSTTGYEDNEPCYACHSSTGEVPSQHPDKQKTPYVCTDCHLSSGTKAGAYGAPIVSEHYLNGTDITASTGATSALQSCLNCHQNSSITELRDTGNNDPDNGTFDADGDGVYGGAISAYHYGKISSQLNNSGVANCTYCHQQSSNFDSIMQDSTHNNMKDHTDNAGGPDCTNSTCHSTGRMHESSLTKPTLSSSLCTSCHTTKETHAGKVECTTCHTEQSRDIHGIKYIQQDGSYNQYSPGSPANCTTCHVGSGLGGNFSSAPTFSSFAHSNSNVSGGKWNKTSQAYWNSTLNACYFCHGNTKHSNNAFGKIDDYNITGSNTKDGSITSTSYWCANCHYDNSLDNYNGSAFTPKVVNFSGWGINASDGTNYEDHISKGYVNSTSHGDSKCNSCHGSLIGGGATTKDFVHQVGQGVSGDRNCISCHDVGASSAPDVDFNATNHTLAAHRDLNSGVSTSLPAANKKCWACHTQDGKEPPAGSHPTGYNTPKTCEDCHTTGAFGAPLVKEHYKNGDDIQVTGAECYNCHSLSENQVTNSDNEKPSSYTSTDDNKSYASHYVKVRDDLKSVSGEAYCGYCHQQQKGGSHSGAYNPFFNNTNRTVQPDHTSRLKGYSVTCFKCHGSGSNLHGSALKVPNYTKFNTECRDCHIALTGSKSHTKNIGCKGCHVGSTNKIHNVTYLQNDGQSFKTAKETWLNSSYATCYTCHVQGLADSTMNTYYGVTPLKIPFSGHGNGSYGGTTYWSDNYTACKFCHTTTHDEDVPIGRGVRAAGLTSGDINNLNASINSGSTWCGSCHITSDSDYYWTVTFYFEGIMKKKPPVITPGSGNHTTLSAPYTDDKCASCHYGGSVTDGMDAFVHGIQ